MKRLCRPVQGLFALEIPGCKHGNESELKEEKKEEGERREEPERKPGVKREAAVNAEWTVKNMLEP